MTEELFVTVSLTAFRWVAWLSLPVYVLFEMYDRKQVKDEREELVRLKTFELVHKVTITTASAFALIYLLVWRNMDAAYPLAAIGLATMGTEIAGKLFYRRQL